MPFREALGTSFTLIELVAYSAELERIKSDRIEQRIQASAYASIGDDVAAQLLQDWLGLGERNCRRRTTRIATNCSQKRGDIVADCGYLRALYWRCVAA